MLLHTARSNCLCLSPGRSSCVPEPPAPFLRHERCHVAIFSPNFLRWVWRHEGESVVMTQDSFTDGKVET